MTNLWYKDITVIKDEPFQFIPSNNLSEHQKINAIARFGIYLVFIFTVFRLNSSYLGFPILLIIVSFLLGRTEKFGNQSNKQKCYKPTEVNPFMNFTMDDYYKNVDRPANCPVPEVRKDEKTIFKKSNSRSNRFMGTKF